MFRPPTTMSLAQRRVVAKRAFRRAIARGCNIRQWVRVVANIMSLNGASQQAIKNDIGAALAATLAV